MRPLTVIAFMLALLSASATVITPRFADGETIRYRLGGKICTSVITEDVDSSLNIDYDMILTMNVLDAGISGYLLQLSDSCFRINSTVGNIESSIGPMLDNISSIMSLKAEIRIDESGRYASFENYAEIKEQRIKILTEATLKELAGKISGEESKRIEEYFNSTSSPEIILNDMTGHIDLFSPYGRDLVNGGEITFSEGIMECTYSVALIESEGKYPDVYLSGEIMGGKDLIRYSFNENGIIDSCSRTLTYIAQEISTTVVWTAETIK